MPFQRVDPEERENLYKVLRNKGTPLIQLIHGFKIEKGDCLVISIEQPYFSFEYYQDIVRELKEALQCEVFLFFGAKTYLKKELEDGEV